MVVTKSGVVLDRVLTLDRDLSLAELEGAAAFLNQNFRGWSIERIRAELPRRMEQERSEYDQLLRSIDELCRKGALEQDTAVNRDLLSASPTWLRATRTENACVDC